MTIHVDQLSPGSNMTLSPLADTDKTAQAKGREPVRASAVVNSGQFPSYPRPSLCPLALAVALAAGQVQVSNTALLSHSWDYIRVSYRD